MDEPFVWAFDKIREINDQRCLLCVYVLTGAKPNNSADVSIYTACMPR